MPEDRLVGPQTHANDSRRLVRLSILLLLVLISVSHSGPFKPFMRDASHTIRTRRWRSPRLAAAH